MCQNTTTVSAAADESKGPQVAVTSLVFSANTLTHNQDNEEPDSGVCLRKMGFKCVVVCILIQRVH